MIFLVLLALAVIFSASLVFCAGLVVLIFTDAAGGDILLYCMNLFCTSVLVFFVACLLSYRPDGRKTPTVNFVFAVYVIFLAWTNFNHTIASQAGPIWTWSGSDWHQVLTGAKSGDLANTDERGTTTPNVEPED